MIMPMSERATSAFDEASWAAVTARDTNADGRFVFGVRTTGIYCRPSCPARRPNRGNVAFFADGPAARSAGFRPCRRCRPDLPVRDPVAEAHQLLADSNERLTLEQLAARVALSAGHLQRQFKARYGLSPRSFQDQKRQQRLRSALRSGLGVSRATFDAGYGSSSRVYERAHQQLGMTPGQFARGAAGLTIEYLTVASTVTGRLLVAATDRGVCAVLPGQSDEALEAALRAEFPAATRRRRTATQNPSLAALARRIAEGFEGRESGTTIAIDLQGTAFQERVWKALLDIRTGDTRTYAEVARAIGKPRAVRAVASAIAHNRLAVVVPCHRVIRGNGTMAGYRWGLPLKERLLAAERGSTRSR